MEVAIAAKGVSPQSNGASARPRTEPDNPPTRRDDSNHRRARENSSWHGSERHARDTSHNGYRDDTSHANKLRRLHSPGRDQDRHRSNGHSDDARRHSNNDHDRRQHDTHANLDSSRPHANGEANGHERDDNGKGRKGGTQYGLSWGETAPQELQAHDRWASLGCQHWMLC